MGQIFVGGDPLPYMLTLIMRMCLNSVCLILVLSADYENILTTKISRFTVLGGVVGVITSFTSIAKSAVCMQRRQTSSKFQRNDKQQKARIHTDSHRGTKNTKWLQWW